MSEAREILARLECRRCYIASGGYVDVDRFVNDWWSNHVDHADREIAALDAAGFAIVPKVATEAMRIAAVAALGEAFKPDADKLRAMPASDQPPAWVALTVVSSRHTDPIWPAMLTAAGAKT